nr:DNA-binding protein [Bacillales bacterium]
MARKRSPKRDKAYELWAETNGERLLKDIAEALDVKPSQIRKWKNQDEWEVKLKGNVTKPKKSNVTKKRGAPKGNKNAVGNGAPERNKNAEKHGLFSKYLPEETLELVEHFEQEDQIVKLKRNIAIQEAAIIRAQKIMHVESKEEIIKHLRKVQSGNIDSEEWEFQYAWDRQGNFLNSLSRAMSTLTSMYKQLYELTRELDPEGDIKDKVNSFVKALTDSAEDVWDDEEEE